MWWTPGRHAAGEADFLNARFKLFHCHFQQQMANLQTDKRQSISS